MTRVFHGKEAARLHKAIVGQDNIDTTMDTEQRRRVRNALKYGLRRRTGASGADSRGRLKDWFIRKLDSLMAYSLLDTRMITERQGAEAKGFLFEGGTQRHIALSFGISESQVRRDIAHVLNAVIASAPLSLLTSQLQFAVSPFILHGCSHCGDTLEWDRDGAHEDGEGEYVCMHCGRRFTFDLRAI